MGVIWDPLSVILSLLHGVSYVSWEGETPLFPNRSSTGNSLHIINKEVHRLKRFDLI